MEELEANLNKVLDEWEFNSNKETRKKILYDFLDAIMSNDLDDACTLYDSLGM